MRGRRALASAALAPIALVAACALVDQDPPELDCNRVPPEVPAWLVRSCVLSVTCSPFAAGRTIGACIRDVEPLSSEYHACLKDAVNCGDFAKCRGFGRASAAQCTGATKGWHCDGNVGVRCGYGDPYFVDCAQLGGTCLGYGYDDVLEMWPCALGPTKCTGKTGWWCEGSKRVSCSGGMLWGHDCAAQHLACRDALGGAVCDFAGEPCEKIGRTCQGDKLMLCEITGRRTHDCGIVGGACVDESGKERASCQPKDCSFGDGLCHEACLDATHARVCLKSAWYYEGEALVVDCTAHGFSRCAEVKRKGDSPYATCR